MGAAASIQTELAKPKDASDIPEGTDAAKSEVARLRKLIRSQYVRSRPLKDIGRWVDYMRRASSSGSGRH